MKDLEASKQVLSVSQRHVETITTECVTREFNLGNHFRLIRGQSPKSKVELDYMNKVPYACGIGSLMYAMICKRSNIDCPYNESCKQVHQQPRKVACS